MKFRLLILLVLIASSCSPAEVKKPVNTSAVFELPSTSSLNSSDLDPVRSAIEGKKIVMLGESIHMTSELPRVRERLIRNLHEAGEYGLLLFEGSPMEFWIAEEEYLTAKPAVESAANFQRTALFGLWQTDEMRAVIDYSLRTQAGAGGSDLYVSSYDVQIGQGRRFRDGKGVFETLIGLLQKRDRRISSMERDAILVLEGLASCSRKKFPGSEEEAMLAQQGIDALTQVIARTSKASSEEVHERILRFLPTAAGYSLEFCREANSETDRKYTEIRDEWASKQFLEMFSTLGQKTLVWAHSNHVRQLQRTDRAASFGAYVRQSLPKDVFAIQFTGTMGSALAFMDGGKEIEPVAKTLLPLAKVTLESKLSALSQKDFFVTSADLPAEFGGQESARSEPEGSMLIDPRRDFDGYYLVQQINPPRLRF